MPQGKQWKLLLLDDHAILRRGLRMLLESEAGFSVVGEASNRSEVVALATQEHPDVVLLDIDLGPECGLDAIQPLREAVPDIRVLVLTGVRDQETHRRAIELGAHGLVEKEGAAQVLIDAIREVAAGGTWIDDALRASILANPSGAQPPPASSPEAAKIASVSAREMQVIELIGEGLTNRMIGERLAITETTVRHHLTSIFAKLGVRDRLELLLYAYRNGLIRASGGS